jgi:hypothetical protein
MAVKTKKILADIWNSFNPNPQQANKNNDNVSAYLTERRKTNRGKKWR